MSKLRRIFHPAIGGNKDHDGDHWCDAWIDHWCAGWVAGWNAQAEIKERTCYNEGSNSARLNDFSCSACDYFNDHRDPDEVFNYCPNCGAKVIDND